MKTNSQLYLIGIILLSMFGVVSIILITIARPDRPDNQIIITTILGFLTPTILTIIALMVKDTHDLTNSRMTELLEITRTSSLAEGKLKRKGISATELENLVPQSASLGNIENAGSIAAIPTGDKIVNIEEVKGVVVSGANVKTNTKEKEKPVKGDDSTMTSLKQLEDKDEKPNETLKDDTL